MIEMIEKVDKEREDYKEDSYNSIDKLHCSGDGDEVKARINVTLNMRDFMNRH